MLKHIKGKRNLSATEREILRIIQINSQPFESAMCEYAILPRVKKFLSNKKFTHDAASFPNDYDYENLGYRLLYHFCFQLLTSGELHIYRGSLSPTGDAVYHLYRRILDYYEANHMLGDSSVEKQMEILNSYIMDVG